MRSSLRQSEAERDALSAAMEEARRSSAAAQSRIQQLEEVRAVLWRGGFCHGLIAWHMWMLEGLHAHQEC